MKKLLLAILLVLALVAVSYYKTSRQTSKAETAYREGYSQGSAELDVRLAGQDSLRQLIVDYDSVVAESLGRLRASHRRETDSLTEVISAQKDSLKRLAAAQQAAARSATAHRQDASASSGTADGHRKILAAYNKRYKELPNDLSPYERRVALSEIREETAKEFSISVAELNKIRKKNNLDY
jgi:polyribonucleotide nucleotidyltransferase